MEKQHNIKVGLNLEVKSVGRTCQVSAFVRDCCKLNYLLFMSIADSQKSTRNFIAQRRISADIYRQTIKQKGWLNNEKD